MKQLFLAAALAAALPALAETETYSIDPAHTVPAFEVKHMGMSTQRGFFNKASGKITLDRAAKKGSADIAVDLSAISTSVPKLGEHLRSEDFFDAAKYPTITFKGSDFKFEGDKVVAVNGELTMRGVTKPATLKVESFNCGNHPMTKKAMCGADITTTVKRSDFGVKYGVPMVGDDVKISIPVEAFKD